MKRRRISATVFWAIMVIMFALAMYTANGQTSVSVGGGVFEQSNEMGIGLATSVGLQQGVLPNVGFNAVYTQVFLKEENLNQAQLQAYYEVLTTDEKLALRLNGGVATQFGNDAYPTFGIDILGMRDRDIHPYFSWSPVVRGAFRDKATGWSHTVQAGLIFKL